MVAKAYATTADEVVVDLEDAVAIDAKDQARATVTRLGARDRGSLAVRVNAEGTSWHLDDLLACAGNPAVGSVVVPKVESAAQVAGVAAALAEAEATVGRTTPLTIQALIESPRALVHVASIAESDHRLTSLIIGYADLAASLGRHPASTWQFARDAVLVAARSAGIQAIDGPHLTVEADDGLLAAATLAADQGFDGKWVIHPRQIDIVTGGFTPPEEAVADAREIVAVMTEAQLAGTGAVAWRGRMLDEALVVAARRVLERAGQG